MHRFESHVKSPAGLGGLKLPCIGMFDVNEAGKICGRRDYCDNSMWFSTGGPTLHLD